MQSGSSSGTLSVSVVEGPESQEVAHSAPKKRKIPVGIVLPNQVSFMELSQLETFVDSINKIRGCKTSKCDGNLVPIFVRSVGGGIHIRFGCNGCRSKQALFETYSKYKPAERSNCISLSVQVAFIMAGGTHVVYAKTLSHALGMKTVNRVTYLKTIKHMYPFVIDVLDRMCETAKTDMKAKNYHELGPWKRAVTTADGTWQTRVWYSKNATFSIRNYLNGALLYYHHLCQKGSDDVVEGGLSNTFIAKAHTNFTSILIEAQSQKEYVKRVKVLPRHAVDNHSQCDYHSLVVCSCGACKNKEAIECKGKAYKSRFQLDCKFHALLYETECNERTNQAEELIHPVLKRGHSNALEASHNVFIRFRTKDVFLQRLHYHLSTNLALLQANLTYSTKSIIRTNWGLKCT